MINGYQKVERAREVWTDDEEWQTSLLASGSGNYFVPAEVEGDIWFEEIEESELVAEPRERYVEFVIDSNRYKFIVVDGEAVYCRERDQTYWIAANH